MKKVLIATTLIALTHAHAERLPINDDARMDIGVLATYNARAYDTDGKLSVMPLFLYDNNRIYAEGAHFGYYPYKNDKHWVRIGVAYDGTSFDPSDANTLALQGLDKRKSSLNATVSYMYISPYGGLELVAAQDVLDRSDGQTVSLAHRGRFYLMDNKLVVYPKVGIMWRSEDYNNYYYGISADESARTGLPRHHTTSSISPFISASAHYHFNDKFGLFAHQRVDWLSSTQKDSPMVDGSTDISTNIGITYTF